MELGKFTLILSFQLFAGVALGEPSIAQRARAAFETCSKMKGLDPAISRVTEMRGPKGSSSWTMQTFWGKFRLNEEGELTFTPPTGDPIWKGSLAIDELDQEMALALKAGKTWPLSPGAKESWLRKCGLIGPHFEGVLSLQPATSQPAVPSVGDGSGRQ